MEEKRDNLVYDRFIVPVKLHYYGYTDDVKKRKKQGYKTTALQLYIDIYGWENITTTIVAEGLTKKEAELLENKLIIEGWERGDCINKQGSGGYQRDNPKEYRQQWYKDHREEKLKYQKQYREEHIDKIKEYHKEHREKRKQYDKQRRSTPEGKIYKRVEGFNYRHPDKIIETPLEAKQKYLQRGYIPDYIKNDDLV